jgi:hypothetical protein
MFPCPKSPAVGGVSKIAVGGEPEGLHDSLVLHGGGAVLGVEHAIAAVQT